MDVGRTLFYTNAKDGTLFLKNKTKAIKHKTRTSLQATTTNKKVTLGKIQDFRHFSTLF